MGAKVQGIAYYRALQTAGQGISIVTKRYIGFYRIVEKCS